MKLPQATIALLENVTSREHEPTCIISPSQHTILGAQTCPYCTGYRSAQIEWLVRESKPTPAPKPLTTWTVTFEGEEYEGEYFPPESDPGVAGNFWQFERQHPRAEGFQKLDLFPDADSEGGRLIHGQVQDENGTKLGHGSVVRS